MCCSPVSLPLSYKDVLSDTRVWPKVNFRSSYDLGTIDVFFEYEYCMFILLNTFLLLVIVNNLQRLWKLSLGHKSTCDIRFVVALKPSIKACLSTINIYNTTNKMKSK